MAMEYWPCYHSYRKKCEKLSDQELGRLFRALMDFSETGAAKELAGRESIAFDFIADDIRRAKESYEAKCQTNRENVGKRYDGIRSNTVEYDGIRSNTNAYETYQSKSKSKGKSKGKSNTSSADAEGSNSARFAPPSVDEVRAYCLERRNEVDAESFVAFYASKGWRVGNQPMKDWKAAVRTWERRDDRTAGRSAAKRPTEKPWTGDDLDRLERMLNIGAHNEADD